MYLCTKKRLDGESEYCLVQTVTANDNEECYSEETIDTANCHICNVEVPVTCYKEHTESERHVTLENIFQNILKRLSKQIKVTVIHNDNSIDKDLLYHCVPCSKIIKIDNKHKHEISRYHIRSQKELSIVQEFYKIFKKENQINSNDVEAVENEEVVDEESAMSEKSISTEHVQINTINNCVSESVQDIISNDETNTVCYSNDHTTKLTSDDNLVSNSFEENYFKKIIRKHGLKVDLPIVDGDFVHVANPSGIKVKIFVENFHSFRSISYYLYCQLCDFLFKPKNKNKHKGTRRHARNIFIQVNEQFARMLCNTFWSHCLICNEVYQTTDFSNHCLFDDNHIEMLESSKLFDVCQNDEETNTATVNDIEHTRSGKRESGERWMVEYIPENEEQTKTEKFTNDKDVYVSNVKKLKYSDNKEYFGGINMSENGLENAITKNENAITKDENIIIKDVNAITKDENTITEDEKKITKDENIITEDKNTITEDENTISEDENTITKDKNTIIEHENIITKDENAISKDENTITKDVNEITKDENTITADENAITKDENTVTIDVNAITKDENAITKDGNTITEDEHTITKDENAITKDVNEITKDGNTITEDENTITKDENTITKDENAITKDVNEITKNENTITEDENTITEDKNTITEDENTITEDENTITEDENTITEDENTVTEDKNTTTKDENTIIKHNAINIENAITKDENFTSSSISNGDIAPTNPFRFSDSTKTKLTCVVCDIDIDNTQRSIDAHEVSSKHDSSVKDLLCFHSIKRSYNHLDIWNNDINKLNAGFLFCISCKIKVTDIWEHIKTEKHTALIQLEFEMCAESLKTFVYKCKGRYSKASRYREYYKMLLKTNKVDKLLNSHYCSLCKLELFEEGSEIEHMLSAKHITKLAKIFKSRQT